LALSILHLSITVAQLISIRILQCTPIDSERKIEGDREQQKENESERKTRLNANKID